VRAHRLAVEALRAGPGDYPVGLTLSMAEITADEGGESPRDGAEEMLENVFLRATDGDDFVGVQCYTRMHFGPDGLAGNDPAVPLTQMGDERWPQAVEHTVRRAAAISGRPVMVTENGIATDDDTERIAFVSEALESAHRCICEGIDLRGYFVWSLLDNFEWHLGYGPKFGIVTVDPVTFERRPKPSAYWFGEVARANALVPGPK
jgi:beta-glucosidase